MMDRWYIAMKEVVQYVASLSRSSHHIHFGQDKRTFMIDDCNRGLVAENHLKLSDFCCASIHWARTKSLIAPETTANENFKKKTNLHII